MGARAEKSRPCLERVKVSVAGREATVRWKDWPGWTYRTKFSRPGGKSWPKGWSRESGRAAISREIRMGAAYKVRIQGIHRTDERGHRTHRTPATTVAFTPR